MIFTINKKKNTTMSEQFQINRKMVGTGRIDTHNTQIHDRSRSWLIVHFDIIDQVASE